MADVKSPGPPRKDKPVVAKTPQSAKPDPGQRGLKRKLFNPGLEDEDKKSVPGVTPKKKKPGSLDSSPGPVTGTPKPPTMSSTTPKTPAVQRLTERQQMQILMQMTAESEESSSKPNSPQTPASGVKKTPLDKKVNKRNERGETPLHLAAIKGDVKQTKKLIKAGADVNVVDYAGWTPLHEACNHGHIVVAKQLLKAGANVNVQGLDDDTPLHDASINGHAKLVTLLVRHGANAYQPNKDGKKPLDIAASPDIVKLLKGEPYGRENIQYSSDSGSSLDDIRSPASPASTISDKDDSLHVGSSGFSSEGSGIMSHGNPAFRRHQKQHIGQSSPRLTLKFQQIKQKDNHNKNGGKGDVYSVVMEDMDTDVKNPLLSPGQSSRSSSPGSDLFDHHTDVRTSRDNLGVSSSTLLNSVSSSVNTITSNTTHGRSREAKYVVHPFRDREHLVEESKPNRTEHKETFLERLSEKDPYAPEFEDISDNEELSLGKMRSSSRDSREERERERERLARERERELEKGKERLKAKETPHISAEKAAAATVPIKEDKRPDKSEPSSAVNAGSHFGLPQIPRKEKLNTEKYNKEKIPDKTKEKNNGDNVRLRANALAEKQRTKEVEKERESFIIKDKNQKEDVRLNPSTSENQTDKNNKRHSPENIMDKNTRKHSPENLLDKSKKHFPDNTLEKTKRALSSDNLLEKSTKKHSPETVQDKGSKKHSPETVQDKGNKKHSPETVSEKTHKKHSPLHLQIDKTSSEKEQGNKKNISPIERVQRNTTSPVDKNQQRMSSPKLEREKETHQPSSSPTLSSSPKQDRNSPKHTDKEPRSASPKVPPLKIIIPPKTPTSTDNAGDLKKLLNKPVLPYVVNPTREEKMEVTEEGQGQIETVSDTSTTTVVTTSSSINTTSATSTVNTDVTITSTVTNTSVPAVVETTAPSIPMKETRSTTRERREREKDKDTHSRSSDSGSVKEDDSGSAKDSGSEKGRETKKEEEQRPTRTLRSHTQAQQQQQQKENQANDSNSSSEKESNSTNQKNNTDQTDYSNIHPKRRKLRPRPEPASAPEPPAKQAAQPPQEKPDNPFDLFLAIRKQVNKRRQHMYVVQPKAPQGFCDYLINSCKYVLHGNKESRLSVPMLSPPNSVTGPMRDLFVDQEKARYQLRLQHLIEREKLMLSIEQETIRVHGRAARALANQSIPLSVCTILKDEEIYNQIDPIQEAEKEKTTRTRYNGRQFLSWLQDVDDKYDKIKEALLMRHHHEAESLYAVQKMEWEWKMIECGQCKHNEPALIDELHVPMVVVNDDFDLLPT